MHHYTINVLSSEEEASEQRTAMLSTPPQTPPQSFLPSASDFQSTLFPSIAPTIPMNTIDSSENSPQSCLHSSPLPRPQNNQLLSSDSDIIVVKATKKLKSTSGESCKSAFSPSIISPASFLPLGPIIPVKYPQIPLQTDGIDRTAKLLDKFGAPADADDYFPTTLKPPREYLTCYLCGFVPGPSLSQYEVIRSHFLSMKHTEQLTKWKASKDYRLTQFDHICTLWCLRNPNAVAKRHLHPREWLHKHASLIDSITLEINEQLEKSNDPKKVRASRSMVPRDRFDDEPTPNKRSWPKIRRTIHTINHDNEKDDQTEVAQTFSHRPEKPKLSQQANNGEYSSIDGGRNIKKEFHLDHFNVDDNSAGDDDIFTGIKQQLSDSWQSSNSDSYCIDDLLNIPTKRGPAKIKAHEEQCQLVYPIDLNGAPYDPQHYHATWQNINEHYLSCQLCGYTPDSVSKELVSRAHFFSAKHTKRLRAWQKNPQYKLTQFDHILSLYILSNPHIGNVQKWYKSNKDLIDPITWKIHNKNYTHKNNNNKDDDDIRNHNNTNLNNANQNDFLVPSIPNIATKQEIWSLEDGGDPNDLFDNEAGAMEDKNKVRKSKRLMLDTDIDSDNDSDSDGDDGTRNTINDNSDDSDNNSPHFLNRSFGVFANSSLVGKTDINIVRFKIPRMLFTSTQLPDQYYHFIQTTTDITCIFPTYGNIIADAEDTFISEDNEINSTENINNNHQQPYNSHPTILKSPQLQEDQNPAKMDNTPPNISFISHTAMDYDEPPPFLPHKPEIESLYSVIHKNDMLPLNDILPLNDEYNHTTPSLSYPQSLLLQSSQTAFLDTIITNPSHTIITSPIAVYNPHKIKDVPNSVLCYIATLSNDLQDHISNIPIHHYNSSFNLQCILKCTICLVKCRTWPDVVNHAVSSAHLTALKKWQKDPKYRLKQFDHLAHYYILTTARFTTYGSAQYNMYRKFFQDHGKIVIDPITLHVYVENDSIMTTILPQIKNLQWKRVYSKELHSYEATTASLLSPKYFNKFVTASNAKFNSSNHPEIPQSVLDYPRYFALQSNQGDLSCPLPCSSCLLDEQHPFTSLKSLLAHFCSPSHLKNLKLWQLKNRYRPFIMDHLTTIYILKQMMVNPSSTLVSNQISALVDILALDAFMLPPELSMVLDYPQSQQPVMIQLPPSRLNTHNIKKTPSKKLNEQYCTHDNNNLSEIDMDNDNSTYNNDNSHIVKTTRLGPMNAYQQSSSSSSSSSSPSPSFSSPSSLSPRQFNGNSLSRNNIVSSSSSPLLQREVTQMLSTSSSNENIIDNGIKTESDLSLDRYEQDSIIASQSYQIQQMRRKHNEMIAAHRSEMDELREQNMRLLALLLPSILAQDAFDKNDNKNNHDDDKNNSPRDHAHEAGPVSHDDNNERNMNEYLERGQSCLQNSQENVKKSRHSPNHLVLDLRQEISRMNKHFEDMVLQKNEQLSQIMKECDKALKEKDQQFAELEQKLATLQAEHDLLCKKT